MITTKSIPRKNDSDLTWPQYIGVIQKHLDNAEALKDRDPASALAISMAAMKSISESLQQAGEAVN